MNTNRLFKGLLGLGLIVGLVGAGMLLNQGFNGNQNSAPGPVLNALEYGTCLKVTSGFYKGLSGTIYKEPTANEVTLTAIGGPGGLTFIEITVKPSEVQITNCGGFLGQPQGINPQGK
jgi:drug/metabolite transporter (DMT)-like permease